MDTAAQDTALDSGAGTDTASGETGDSGDTSDSADTSGSVDTGDGAPSLEFDIGATYDARIVGDAAGAARSYYDGPHMPVGTGDFDGDGSRDVLLGMPASDRGGTSAGTAFVVRGPVSGSVSTADADAIIVPGDAFEGEIFEAAFSVSTGDVDGDEATDVLLGSPLSGETIDPGGAVFLYLAPLSGARDGATPDAVVTGGDNKQAGWSVAIPGDLDGDGQSEFGFGTLMFPGDGAVYLYSGGDRGALSPGDASAVITGDTTGAIGAWFGPAGDQDGDGLDDLFVAQPTATTRQLLLFRGPVSGAFTEADADIAFSGNDYAGEPSTVGDFNGDGYLDTILSEPADDSGGNNAGAAFLWYGPIVADTDVAASDGSICGDVAEAMLGSSLAAGDVDGDGDDDLLVGAPGWLGSIGGHAWLFSGPVSGANAPADAWAHFAGDGEDAAGFAVALDDLDDDGLTDVIIGAPGDDAGAVHGGTVWIKYASSL